MPQKGKHLRLPPDIHAYLDECYRQYKLDPEPDGAYHLLPSRVVAEAVRRSGGYMIWKCGQKGGKA